MADRAQLSLTAVPNAVAIQKQSAPKVAVGMQLTMLQTLVQTVADQNAPHFAAGSEPLADNRVFPAPDGTQFYRPMFRVASREAPAIGPEVRFLRDADGTVRLLFELEEEPNRALPPGAKPFPVRIDAVVLRWNGGQRTFAQPTFIDNGASTDPFAPAFSLRLGDVLNTSEVEALNAALASTQSGAHLELTYSYGYWVDTTVIVRDHRDDNKPKLPTPTPRPPFGTGPIRPRHLMVMTGPKFGNITEQPAVTMSHAMALNPAVARRIAIEDQLLFSRDALRRAAVEAKEKVRTDSSFRNVSVTRSIPFTFDPSLDQNRLIFSAIRGTGTVQETWTDTTFGPIRRAPFPNTVYCLPNEVRLAFNPDMGTAHVVPNLYRDDHDEVRVRVVLRAVPWFDPEKSVELRDHLYRSSAGALACPQLVAGGYQSAKLEMLTAFPEQIKTLNEASLSVDLSGGIDLTLDLSLEFYRFVCELLTGPLGIVGRVRVLLQETPAKDNTPAVRLERTVDMRLKLDTLASFPVGVAVEEDAVRPDHVTIRNEAGGQLRIGGCVPRLLQVDSNSVVPLEVYDGETDTSFPRQLNANESISLQVKPKIGGVELLWNAVEVNLTKMGLTQTPAQILDRIHEVAPSGTLSWKLTVDCPVFQQNPVPAPFSTVFRVEVQIFRPGFATEQVVLGAQKASAQITMQRTLKDLLATQSGGQFTFKYRVRNVYFDHVGKWSEDKDGEGSNHFVFPNPVAGD
ncbi:MAG: hypothetical protein IT168_19705 [Bryobacterales bacterium]|nr:hypothetical protein [Bryobacterales bacterium]